jgi:hypothetical protein
LSLCGWSTSHRIVKRRLLISFLLTNQAQSLQRHVTPQISDNEYVVLSGDESKWKAMTDFEEMMLA